VKPNLAIGGAVLFDGPVSLGAGLQDPSAKCENGEREHERECERNGEFYWSA
jgi:hypothetical protein